MEALKTAAPEIKKELGRAINELKKHVEAAIAEREAELAASAGRPTPSTSRCRAARPCSATGIRSA